MIIVIDIFKLYIVRKSSSVKIRYLIILLFLLSLISLFIGVSPVNIYGVLSFDQEQIQVLLISRFPRLISIIIAGVSLSICGLIMQQLTRNKFVSPTTAGTMDSARLGVLVALMLFTSASPIQKNVGCICFRFNWNLHLYEDFRFYQSKRSNFYSSCWFDVW